MSLFEYAKDLFLSWGAGDSPEMRALLNDLGLPRRTAGHDSLERETQLAGQAAWLHKAFGIYFQEYKSKIAAADQSAASSGVLIDPWSRLRTRDTERVVTSVVEDFLNRHLSSVLDRKLLFLTPQADFVNRRSSNTVIDALVRKAQSCGKVEHQALVLLEIKDDNRYWVVGARGQNGFVASKVPAYTLLLAEVELAPQRTFAVDEKTDPKVSNLRHIVQRCEGVPAHEEQAWTDSE